MTTSHYIGNELELFSHAHNWKQYYRSRLLPFIKGNVLEAGAGIGETTSHLYNENVERWTCLEPDTELIRQIHEKIYSGKLPRGLDVINGTTDDLAGKEIYDAVLYIDVIEHIEKDHEELQRAFGLLKANGHLIILVPAHQWLYSPFDKAIGHYRRYNKKLLKSAVPPGFKQIKLEYLDSGGLFASLANKLFLHKSYPTLNQIQFWDRTIVPVSKFIDPLTGHITGKSLIGVWKKT